MSTNTIYDKYDIDRFYQIYKESQREQEKAQKVVQKKQITTNEKATNTIYYKYDIDKFYQIYKESQQRIPLTQNYQELSKKEAVEPRKVKPITTQKQQPKSMEAKLIQDNQYKTNKVKVEQIEKKEINNEENFNKIIAFLEGVTIKKAAKFIAIGGIISYIIGYLYGQHLGKDLTEKLEKKKRIEEELVISNKPEEYSLTENQIVSDSTSSKENVEKKEYAYAYNFANNIMEEKYGINISYDNELESNIKTLKRTI